MPRHTTFDGLPKSIELEPYPRVRAHSGPRSRAFAPVHEYGRANMSRSKWEMHFSESNFNHRRRKVSMSQPRHEHRSSTSPERRKGLMPSTFDSALGRSPSFEVRYADGASRSDSVPEDNPAADQLGEYCGADVYGEAPMLDYNNNINDTQWDAGMVVRPRGVQGTYQWEDEGHERGLLHYLGEPDVSAAERTAPVSQSDPRLHTQVLEESVLALGQSLPQHNTDVIEEAHLAQIRAVLESRRGSVTGVPLKFSPDMTCEPDDSDENFVQAVLDIPKPTPKRLQKELGDDDDIYAMLGLKRRVGISNRVGSDEPPEPTVDGGALAGVFVSAMEIVPPMSHAPDAFEDPNDLRAVMSSDRVPGAMHVRLSPRREAVGHLGGVGEDGSVKGGDALDELLSMAAPFEPLQDAAVQTSRVQSSRTSTRVTQVSFANSTRSGGMEGLQRAVDFSSINNSVSSMGDYETVKVVTPREQSLSIPLSERQSRSQSFQHSLQSGGRGSRVLESPQLSRSLSFGVSAGRLEEAEEATPTVSEALEESPIRDIPQEMDPRCGIDEELAIDELDDAEQVVLRRVTLERLPADSREQRRVACDEEEADTPRGETTKDDVISETAVMTYNPVLQEAHAANTLTSHSLMSQMAGHLNILMTVEEGSARTLIAGGEEIAFESILARFAQGTEQISLKTLSQAHQAFLRENPPPQEVTFAPIPSSQIDEMARAIVEAEGLGYSEPQVVPPEVLEGIAKTIAERASSQMHQRSEALREERSTKLYEAIQQASYAAVAEVMQGVTTDPEVDDVDVIAYEASRNAAANSSYFRASPDNDSRSRRDRIMDLVQRAASKAAADATQLAMERVGDADHVSPDELEDAVRTAVGNARAHSVVAADELVIADELDEPDDKPDTLSSREQSVAPSTSDAVPLLPPAEVSLIVPIAAPEVMAPPELSGDDFHAAPKAARRGSFLYTEDCFDSLVPSPPRRDPRQELLRHYHASKINSPSSFHKSAVSPDIKARDEMTRRIYLAHRQPANFSTLLSDTLMDTSNIAALSTGTTRRSSAQAGVPDATASSEKVREQQPEKIHWGSPLPSNPPPALQDMGSDRSVVQSTSFTHRDEPPSRFVAAPVSADTQSLNHTPPALALPDVSSRPAMTTHGVGTDAPYFPPLEDRDSEGNVRRLRAQLDELRLRSRNRV